MCARILCWTFFISLMRQKLGAKKGRGRSKNTWKEIIRKDAE